MSLARDCAACMSGDHDEHDPSHGIREGLIGGTYCACQGDCAARAAVEGDRIAALFDRRPVTDMDVRLLHEGETMTLTEFLLARIAEDEARVDGIHQGSDPDFFWGPDQIRAECEAKRRIVEMFSGNLHEKWDDGYEAGKMAAPILGTLASVHADHPDYREEWKP